MIEPGKFNCKMLFSFIDLCAGIGGTRTAFEKVGGYCVYASEIDKFASKTYKSNFHHNPYSNLFDVNPHIIPQHDILVAGFPCQPFSLSGVTKRKSLEKPHGFEWREKGQIFFKIVEIIKEKKPAAFLLENVKHLKYHNNGETFDIIREQLQDVGYDIFESIIDAQLLVPQHRERLYIVGFKKELKIKFIFPSIPKVYPKLKTILEVNPDVKYTISDKLWNYLQEYKKIHRKKGNGFGYGLAVLEGKTRTLSARYFKDGAEILIPQEGKNPRKLTPRECARLMGFDDTFIIPVSNCQAYKQFGNSVAIPIVEYIAWEIVKCLFKNQSPLTYLFNESTESDQYSSNGELGTSMPSLGELEIIQAIH
jgi:DNA (cytosine-5)-methyltransferase 1